MRAENLFYRGDAGRAFPSTLTAIVLALLISPGVARAFSIMGVSFLPSGSLGAIPPNVPVQMTVDIATPSMPAWLYQPTQVATNGKLIVVDVFPTSGLMTVIGALQANVNLGVFAAGTYEYEVRLHPDFVVGWGTKTNHGTFKVAEQPTIPVVTIRATDPEAKEGGDTGEFTISRSAVASTPLVVGLRFSGNASNGTDYVLSPTTAISSIVIPAGSESAKILVTPVENNQVESPETVVASLDAYPRLENYSIGSPSYATVTIYDNDLPPTNLPPTALMIFPTNGQSFAAPANIQLTAQVEDPDGLATAAKVEFFSGETRLGLGVLRDPGPPHVAVFQYYWTNVPTGRYALRAKATDAGGATATSAPVQLTVGTPAPPPTISILAPTNHQSFTAPADLVVRAKLHVVLSHWHLVELFAGLNRVGVQALAPLSNSPTEGDTTRELLWSQVAAGEYALKAKVTDLDTGNSAVSEPVAINVRADLRPEVTVRAGIQTTWEEDGSIIHIMDPSATFVISRNGDAKSALPVQYTVGGTASNGVDYSAISNLVIIPAGQTSAVVRISALDDKLVENRETVVLRLSDPICVAIYPPPPDCYRVGSSREAVVYIEDNDAPVKASVVTIQAATPLASEPDKAAQFTIYRTSPVDQQLTVYYALAGTASNGTDYVKLPGTVVIPAGKEAASITITPIDDSLVEGAETVAATLTYPPIVGSVALPYSIGMQSNAVVTIQDNDFDDRATVVTIETRDAVASEGTNWFRWPGRDNTPSTGFGGTNTATFLIRRTGPTNTSLTVLYAVGGTASNGMDYAALPGTVIIPAGERSIPVVIVPKDDTLQERIETIVLELQSSPAASPLPSYVIGLPRRAEAVLVDNDQPRPLTRVLQDRTFHLTAPGNSGAWFVIETSADLLHWTPLATNLVSDGALHFADPDASDAPNRFYRALPAPVPSGE